MRYIGIDIGKRKCDFCVLNGKGRVLERGQFLNTKDKVKEIADKMAAKYGKTGCRAACETTANLWRLTYDAFENAGIDIKLANTFKMAIISKTGKKTDKIDAEKIANVLRMGMLPACYVPDAHTRALRGMIRRHVALVQNRTQEVNRIRSILDTERIEPNVKKLHSEAGLDYLDGLTLGTEQDTEVLHQITRHVRYITNEIKTLDERLEAEAADNEYAKILASMTGVGIYFALLFAVEIADIGRFLTPKHLVSWSGTCPTVYQSGDETRHGKMKKFDTDKLVNWAICEAANVAVRFDPKFQSIYESAKLRHSGKHALAIPVVANKMITIMWHMLKTMSPYESRHEARYKRKLARMRRRSRK